MKTISVVTGCFNEEENVAELYERVRNAIVAAGPYRYEHIFIDNASTDSTVERIKSIACRDSNVKVIVNARNFGHIRSPIHAIFQASGDAIISMASDLQDPPELIAQFIREWENGYSMVLAVKDSTDERFLMARLRRKYYRLVTRLSGVQTFENFTGFGLYERRVIELVKSFDDPYPYFRGMIAEIGLPHKLIPFHQPRRKRGVTKNNFYTLYDIGMLGITNLSKVPLRLMTFTGFAGAVLSFLVACGYLFYKLLFWDRFSVGIAPVVIGIFFVASIQLLFMGVLGEYVGAIHTQIQHRPYAVELERMNFEYEAGLPNEEGAICRTLASTATVA
jgi:glycosyltransferase involved in cell wall biosynthesis